jgi:hypothetical protein
MKTSLKLSVAVLAVAFSGVVAAQSTPAKPVRIRGEIASFSDGTLTVKRPSGDTAVIKVGSDVKVSSVKKVTLADIKKGSFVGIAAKTGVDGKMTAQEVLVFPEAARGTGEGHYDWDLTSKSTMTNANVDNVVEGSDGRNLKLSYKGGTNSIMVPTSAPIVTPGPATTADLIAGKKIFIGGAVPTGKNTFTASRVTVEKDGVAPPM